jgi:hypothetical protein
MQGARFGGGPFFVLSSASQSFVGLSRWGWLGPTHFPASPAESRAAMLRWTSHYGNLSVDRWLVAYCGRDIDPRIPGRLNS